MNPSAYKYFSDTVGNTPLIKLKNLDKSLPGNVFLKLEFFNPMSTVKDRPCLAMLNAAEKEGLITQNTTIIEPSRGSTAFSLASLCASKGYKLIITAPDTLNLQQKAWFLMLGAELILTPPEEGIWGSVVKAEELTESLENAFMPNQFSNANNWQSHYETTGPEIWKDTEGDIDTFIAGIGPGFIADIMDTSLIDELTSVSSEEAKKTVENILRYEGIPIGMSSGATVCTALKKAALPENEGKNVVAMVTSFTERYLTSDFTLPYIEEAKKLKIHPLKPKLRLAS